MSHHPLSRAANDHAYPDRAPALTSAMLAQIRDAIDRAIGDVGDRYSASRRAWATRQLCARFAVTRLDQLTQAQRGPLLHAIRAIHEARLALVEQILNAVPPPPAVQPAPPDPSAPWQSTVDLVIRRPSATA